MPARTRTAALEPAPEYRAVFEASSDGLVISDIESGVVLEANPAFCRMHGYDDMTGLHPSTFIHPDSHSRFETYVNTIRDGSEYRGRAHDVRRDGTIFDVEVLGRGFTYQGRLAMLGVVRDVTAEVRAYELLEQRVAERTRELEALANENARLHQQSERRRQEIEALYDADQALHRSLQLDEVLQALVDAAMRLLKVDAAGLWGPDPDPAYGDRVVPLVSRGLSPEYLAQTVHFNRDRAVMDFWWAHETFVIEDVSRDARIPPRQRAALEREGCGSLLSTQIRIGEEVFGSFTVGRRSPHRFDDQEQRLLIALAKRAALAIKNAHLYERAQQVATLEERQRLARELHDAVTQTLFSTALIAEVLPELWQLDPDDGRKQLSELRRLTRGALAEMRTLLVELRPGALTELPLGDLLRQLAEATSGRTRLDVTSSSAGTPRSMPPAVQVAFYRIAQEALNNVLKHARARQVAVTLTYEPQGEVRLWLRDDGCGFDQSSVPAGHLGLSIMRERANAIGAALRITSQVGQGTSIDVRWPDPDQEELSA